MTFKTARKRAFFISPFMVVGVLVILLPIFGMMTLDRLEKQKGQVKEQLLVKGISLIRTFEAGTRTGMLSFKWGERRLQRMLLETSYQPQVLYMMITDGGGRILAHSDADLVGSIYGDLPELTGKFDIPHQVDYRVRKLDEDPVFEVFKPFVPLKSRFRMDRKFRHGMMGMHPPRDGRRDRGRWDESQADRQGQGQGCTMFAGASDLYIYVGLSMVEADRMESQLKKEALVRGGLYLLLGCVGVVSLVSFAAYRTARADLSSVQAFSDQLVENMPAGLIAVDQDGRVSLVNHAARHILGPDIKELPPGMAAMDPALAHAPGPVSGEVEWTAPDGKIRVLDVTASPLQGEDGPVPGALFLFKDLTQIKRLTREIKTTRHLAAIGKLAGGVAHEIRNPLSSIKGLATYFGQRYEVGSQDRETAEIMVQEVERINRAVTQLLEFARPMAVTPQAVDLEALVSHSLKLIRPDLEKHGITADFTAGEWTSPEFTTDPDRINQVLLNLYMNAIQAMESGGRLTVTLAGNAEGAEIRVADTGCGMEESMQEDIFDPYFTTRPQGTGLGLSIVHRIVDSLKGSIGVVSRAGEGSEFTLALPPCDTNEQRKG